MRGENLEKDETKEAKIAYCFGKKKKVQLQSRDKPGTCAPLRLKNIT